MTNLNQTDLDVRRVLIAQYIGNFAKEIADDMFMGKKCVPSKLRTLKLLVAYLEVLRDYQVLSDEVTEDDNCITEQEAQDILEHISKLTNIHFADLGITYNPA